MKVIECLKEEYNNYYKMEYQAILKLSSDYVIKLHNHCVKEQNEVETIYLILEYAESKFIYKTLIIF